MLLRAALLAGLGGCLSVCLSAACGSGQPPKGPAHKVSATVEAQTPCPKERKRAQEAREALLDGGGVERTRKAAETVLAHAECEARAAIAIAAPEGNQDEILRGVRALRAQVQDADNLYAEVERYDIQDMVGPALLARAALQKRFAMTVQAIQTPTELDARARGEFDSELRDVVQVLMLEAEAMRVRACEALAATNSGDPTCI